MVIRILFLAANPSDTQQLRLDEEVRAIDTALQQIETRALFDVRSHWALRIGDLQALLLRYQPEIVHFSGHGSDRNEIILLDENGRSVVVAAHALRDLFEILPDRTRCVVLNACFSAGQAAAIAEHIDCVIGMSNQISDRASTEFAAAFYRALAYGRTVKTAFELGCNQIHLAGYEEAHQPQLLSKHDPAQIRFVDSDRTSPIAPKGPTRTNDDANRQRPWWERLPELGDSQDAVAFDGDVIITTIGAGARNVAVGKNVRQIVHESVGEPKPEDKAIIQEQFDRIKVALRSLQGQQDVVKIQMTEFQLQLLESELVKTEDDQVPSATAITQLGDRLLDDFPQIADELERLLALPAVGRVIGKAGDTAVLWVQQRFADGRAKS